MSILRAILLLSIIGIVFGKGVLQPSPIFKELSDDLLPEVEFTQFLELSDPSSTIVSTNTALSYNASAVTPNDQSKKSANPLAYRHIDGKIKMSGTLYHTSCRCHDLKASWLLSNTTECFAPVRLRVRQERRNNDKGLKREQLAQLIGKPSSHHKSIFNVKDNTFHDVDGRVNGLHLSTPGGEYGEFISALGVYERSIRQRLTVKEIKQLVSAWLDWSGRPKLYFPTDVPALEQMRKTLRVNGEVGNVVEINLEKPNEDHKAGLRISLRDPRNHGSRFIKLLLSNSIRFGLRDDLAGDAIVALFDAIWNTDADRKHGTGKISELAGVEVLEGAPSQEKGWIDFVGNRHCEHELKTPAFKPQAEYALVYTNNPEGIQYVRHRLSQFFAHHASTAGLDLGAFHFFKKINKRAARNTQVAAEMMARELPFYRVTVE